MQDTYIQRWLLKSIWYWIQLQIPIGKKKYDKTDHQEVKTIKGVYYQQRHVKESLNQMYTSTLEARNTQVGAMRTGSILFREYLQNETSYLNINQEEK